jgi:hypothetical protein
MKNMKRTLTFLAALLLTPLPSGKQSGPAETQGKSGWQMVRLVDVDYANPQMCDYVCFVRAHAPRLSHRRYLADVAVVHSAWSEIASMNVFNPVMGKFVDEYCGWCDFLGETYRQWDVVLQAELTAENLARYPVVVLPSVMTLTDAHISELRRYVEGGGRVVATGETGTRYGPERYLAPRNHRRRRSAIVLPTPTCQKNAQRSDYFRSINFFISSVMGMTSKSLKNILQSAPPCICSPSLPVFSHSGSTRSDVQNPFRIWTSRSP